MRNTIGDILIQLRKKSNESQEKVADDCGIARVSYTRYESNQREPKGSAALSLARHFGVSVEYLYGVQEENTQSVDSLLDANEIEIINIFRQLNNEGQSLLMEHAVSILNKVSMRKEKSIVSMA